MQKRKSFRPPRQSIIIDIIYFWILNLKQMFSYSNILEQLMISASHIQKCQISRSSETCHPHNINLLGVYNC